MTEYWEIRFQGTCVQGGFSSKQEARNWLNSFKRFAEIIEEGKA